MDLSMYGNYLGTTVEVSTNGLEWEWMFYGFFVIVCLLLSCAFGGLWYNLGARVKPVWAQKTAFECGFDPLSSSWSPFTLRFFLLAMIFLAFDVEMVLFFCVVYTKGMVWMSMSFYMKFLLVFFMLILFAGLLHEENEGSLEWK
uniref:NADH dehydrogenase subunit 3 n=1 Tax=Bankia setacea TaxID=693219 RepID=UPI0020281CEA|nr:NADH dehydrogenase subunit 3 [Bankia setacea]UPX89072.1 NADH dehydrogenase subunit 3 [Bankia setacea]UPX89084.1 NADH dehydrogenase subunit 3 [Bankia setacea]UPX89096.1 NADH dehydrogenase subunit 3 [Bankia setacea]UPX89120.1 NADH dehydrogenase subunit 3 [Bankia setacea]